MLEHLTHSLWYELDALHLSLFSSIFEQGGSCSWVSFTERLPPAVSLISSVVPCLSQLVCLLVCEHVTEKAVAPALTKSPTVLTCLLLKFKDHQVTHRVVHSLPSPWVTFIIPAELRETVPAVWPEWATDFKHFQMVLTKSLDFQCFSVNKKGTLPWIVFKDLQCYRSAEFSCH